MGKGFRKKDIDVHGLIERVTAAPDRRIPLHEVWCRLIHGHWKATDAVCEEQFCYLFLKENSAPESTGQAQHIRILEKMLRGSGQKLLAMDLGVACSTVATIAKQALAGLGFECLPSRVPLALVLVARAREDANETQMGRLCAFTRGHERHYILAVGRPDRNLARWLPPAEVEVVKARIEGESHQRIADRRRTSQRTIANQLASACRRLGVSGRLELIGHLAEKENSASLN